MALVKVELFNALRPDMSPVHASALADTAAMMLCIPSSIASRLQLETADHRPVTPADGRRVGVLCRTGQSSHCWDGERCRDERTRRDGAPRFGRKELDPAS